MPPQKQEARKNGKQQAYSRTHTQATHTLVHTPFLKLIYNIAGLLFYDL